MTITKQRVEEIISRIEMYGHGAGYTAEEVYDLAVLALNLSNIAKLKRYELDMDGCDSVQLGNRIEVVPDTGVHEIKYMCSTRDYANANH
ncbi:hypothetical protein seszw2t3_48 [Salmonella phage seszw]|nr:hypothetical protein seszw2t3_48 [Salmonella phage seszw]UJD20531.1 hypothetical protein seszw2t1_47 [Salmonella phage seszw]UJD20598.1 hypothetical protein seszw2t2_47 [Salmonella phage seszw]